MCLVMCSTFIVLFIAALNLIECYRSVHDDSYWRNYLQNIPEDALPGGLTYKGEITYIGEAVYENGIWYGDVRSSGTIYYFIEGELVSENGNLKVFCTKHPERFRWKHIRNASDVNEINEYSIMSGMSVKGRCYVGRFHNHNGTTIGTVCYDNYVRSYVFNGATEYDVFQSKTFEVLMYDETAVVNSTVVQKASIAPVLFVLLFTCVIFK